MIPNGSTSPQPIQDINLLKSLMDNMPDNIYFKDLQSRFIRINQTLANRFGLNDPSQAIGKSDFDFFPQNYAQTTFREEQEIMETGVPKINQLKQDQFPDGQTFWYLVTKAPIRDSKGNLSGLVGISRNISHLKETEHALDQTKSFYISLVENLPQGIFRKDLNHCYTYVNQRFCDVIKKTYNEIIGKTDFDFFPPEFAQNYHKIDLQVIETGNTLSIEQEYQIPGGTSGIVQTVKIPIRNNDGKVIGVQGIFWDITEKKQLEQELQQKTLDLQERIKELNCLYELSRLVENPFLTIDELLSQTTHIIPPSFLHPQKTAVRIRFNDREYHSQPFFESPHFISEDLVVLNEIQGAIEVFYYDDNALSTDPFLDEERSLLTHATERLGKIIERKQVKEKLGLIETLIDQSNDAMYIIDEDSGKILYANAHVSQLLGYSRDEVLNMNLIDFEAVLAEDPNWQQKIKAFKSSGVTRVETKNQRKDGSIIPVEVSIKYLTHEGKNYIVAVSRDITQRKQTELQLKSAKKQAEKKTTRLQSIIDGMNTGIIVANQWDEITEINNWFQQKTHLPRELIIDRNLRRIIHEFTNYSITDIINRFQHGDCKSTVSITCDLLETDMDIAIHFKPIFNQNTYDGVIVNLVDVSHVITAKERAEEQNRFKKEFLSKITQEIRTPLDGIIGMAETLGETDPSDEQASLIEVIRDCSHSMKTILNELDHLSKVESKTHDAESQEINLQQFVNDISSTWLDQNSLSKHILSIQINPSTPDHLYGPPEILAQILTTIYEDAFNEFNHSNLLVKISPIQQIDNKLTLRFAISPEKQSKPITLDSNIPIFNQGSYPGFEIRSSLLQGLVDLLEGELWVDYHNETPLRYCFTASLEEYKNSVM